MFHQRRHYFIEVGMKLEHVRPMPESWLKNLLENLPSHLRSLSSIGPLLVEIQEMYIFATKKAFCKSH